MSVWGIAGAVVDGVMSIPADLYYGGRRTLEDFGAGVQKENSAERDRIVKLVAEIFENRKKIERLVTIVISDFMDKIPDNLKDKMVESFFEKGVKFGSRKSTQFIFVSFVSTRLTQKILTHSVARRVAKFGVGIAVSAVLIQGMIERSSNATQRLEKINPNVHRKLKAENLDVVYFLFEDALAPFLMINAVKIRDPKNYQAFIEMLEDAVK